MVLKKLQPLYFLYQEIVFSFRNPTAGPFSLTRLLSHVQDTSVAQERLPSLRKGPQPAVTFSVAAIESGRGGTTAFFGVYCARDLIDSDAPTVPGLEGYSGGTAARLDRI